MNILFLSKKWSSRLSRSCWLLKPRMIKILGALYILTYRPYGPLLQDTCFEMGTRVFWDQELQCFDRFATQNLETCVKLRVGMRKKDLMESASDGIYTFGSNLVTSQWKEVDSSKHHIGRGFHGMFMKLRRCCCCCCCWMLRSCHSSLIDLD